MSRHYPPQSPLPPLPPYRPYASTRTERLDAPHADAPGYGDSVGSHRSWDDRGPSEYPYGDYGRHSQDYRTDDYGGEDYDAEDYDAYVEGEGSTDRRWAWIAGAAGAILLVAVICTAVILGGGDSGSVSATVGTPAHSRAPVTTSALPEPSAAAPPAMELPPETITTVTPTRPSTPAPSATATPAPQPGPAAVPPATASPRTITYTVNGANQLIDLVTVIYTDQQGALKTDVNVALPWSKTIVLDPGVELKSVTATSVGGQLTCAITDANGATLVAQTNASMIATCTQ
jgi:hypothetical protein